MSSSTNTTAADTSKRVRASDKRMINAKTDVNQLIPFKYNWAWEAYLEASNNHWTPKTWPLNTLGKYFQTDGGHEAFAACLSRVLGHLALRDNAGEHSPTLAAYRHITAPEARQYMLRQSFEETQQGMACEHILDVLKVSEPTVIDFYKAEPFSAEREKLIMDQIRELESPKTSTSTVESAKRFVYSFATYYFGNSALGMYADTLKLIANGKKHNASSCEKDLSVLFSKILKDRGMHQAFGAGVIQSIAQENPQVWDKSLSAAVAQMIFEAAEIEIAACQDFKECAALNINAEDLKGQIQFVASSVAKSIGVQSPYPTAKSVIAWATAISEQSGHPISAASAKGDLSWD